MSPWFCPTRELPYAVSLVRENRPAFLAGQFARSLTLLGHYVVQQATVFALRIPFRAPRFPQTTGLVWCHDRGSSHLGHHEDHCSSLRDPQPPASDAGEGVFYAERALELKWQSGGPRFSLKLKNYRVLLDNTGNGLIYGTGGGVGERNTQE